MQKNIIKLSLAGDGGAPERVSSVEWTRYITKSLWCQVGARISFVQTIAESFSVDPSGKL